MCRWTLHGQCGVIPLRDAHGCVSRNEEELYRSVLSSCEDKLKVVLVENSELRRSLAHMQQELVALLRGDTADQVTSPSHGPHAEVSWDMTCGCTE